MTPRPHASENPASFGQERLWILDHLEVDKLVHNHPAHLRLAGALDTDALRRGLEELVRRHEVLRTHFAIVDGRPIQRIDPPWSSPLPVTELCDLPRAQREAEARRMALEETRRPFDLARGPLVRARLLRIDRDDHILLLTFHPIIFDKGSEGVLFRELAELYRAYAGGCAAPLERLPIQYADFAFWQRQRLQGDVLGSLLSYWKRQVRDHCSVLELPADRTRPAFQTFTAKHHSFQIPKEVAGALLDHARTEGATPFMALLAAFQAFLYRYTQQEDFLVGCPDSGRTRLETEQLIGRFVNVLVLGAEVSGTSTFRDVLRSARDTTTAALAHRELPFERLVEALALRRDTSRAPLVQVLFQLRDDPREPMTFPHLHVVSYEVDSEFEEYDLNVEFAADDDHGFECCFHYSADLFDASTVLRMGTHFRNLLEGISAAPDRAIGLLPLLSRGEEHRLLFEWNDTRRDYPKGQCIHRWFEGQAEKSPDATALVFDDRQLTYRELDVRANQLAHYLRRHAVGPDVLVGICAQRSMEMVVGVLGILKAGGGYLPLDPGYPSERIQFMLADAQVSVLLTHGGLFDDGEATAGDSEAIRATLDPRVHVVRLDRDWRLIAGESETGPANTTTAANLAYVIYTSGSTGQPKGVAIEHRNAVAFLSWVHSAFTHEELSGVLASTSLCFDLSVFEVFAPLTCGGTVILVENVLALGAISNSVRVSLLNTVPSAMSELLRLGAIPATVQTINLAGEPLRPGLVRRIYESTSARKVHDLYGPSECTTYSTWTCRTADGAQTVGRPIANTSVFILDAFRNPVPIGVTGEIYIGGDGVARGYLNRPELTTEKFVHHSFAGAAGQRLYRTGDRARYLPDGNIALLGRVDDQVKIRGYRIELGEIETALARDPRIHDAVAIAREHPSGDKRLVAYVVPKRQAHDSSKDVSGAESHDEQVSEWQALFDDTFGNANEPEDPTTNTAGVNSSYTGSPIAAVETRDWVESAARRILSLNPDRVLDIGCGLGRTLFRVAPHCSQYWGVDFSQAALDYVDRHLDRLGDRRAAIKLVRARADALSGIPAGCFDTVVLNGVTQYFPDIEHLVKVLEGALEAVEPGGVIFVGDVRSLPLLEAFQLSVELFRSPDDVPTESLWHRVKRNCAQEEELVVDPAFFSAIGQRLTKIDQADVLLKRGWAHNELTRFRYDVILYVKPRKQQSSATAWLDWGKERLTLSSVRELLWSDEPRALGIAHVPNSRVLPEYEAVASLGRADGSGTSGALREAIEAMRAKAFHPESFWALQEELPYWVDITWSSPGAPGCVDVVFQHRDAAVVRRPPASFSREPAPPKPWHSYAHNPSEAKRNRLLGSYLRSRLKRRLPDYMIPSAFVVLDALPRTPNGKLDRKALPDPEQAGPDMEAKRVPPHDPIEKLLEEIWAEVLGRKNIGIHDNFFDHGGHSLLATQIILRARDLLQVELTLRTFFEKPTIAMLAMAIKEKQAGLSSQVSAVPPISRQPRTEQLARPSGN